MGYTYAEDPRVIPELLRRKAVARLRRIGIFACNFDRTIRDERVIILEIKSEGWKYIVISRDRTVMTARKRIYCAR